MSIAAADSFRVLLGVMANPTSDRLRTQLREWNGRFAASRRGDVTVRYVGEALSVDDGVEEPCEPL